MILPLEPVGSQAGREAAARAAASREARKAAKRGRALEREAFHRQMHGDVDVPALRAAVAAAVARAEEAPHRAEVMRAFPRQNLNRWVPIGPTVTRRGQAMSRPRVSGRIRDIDVSPDGARAYAISAKGGVWYSGDAGSTWQPVGGWASRSVNAAGNGNLFSGGSLLVDFSGGSAATDVVLVGTGEPSPWRGPTGGIQGGVGILYGRGPATAGIDADPWEPDVGPTALTGVGIYRLARHPAARASSTSVSDGDQDRVLAATTDGLYLGTRSALPAVAAAPPAVPGGLAQEALPARDGFTWAACAAAPSGASPRHHITDVLWLANGTGTRLLFARGRRGVFFSDDDGATAVPIAALQNPVAAGLTFAGRISLARVPGTNRVYVLAELTTSPPAPAKPQRSPRLWQLPDVLASPQTVVAVPGVPTDLFGDPTDPPTQADYDQALVVDTAGANDRIYLGGSTVEPQSGPQGEWSGSLFCFETPAPPAAVAALTPASGVSRRLNPPAGDGADRAGLIGNNVHADIHSIKLTGPAAPARQVWVGCDGGVFVSEHSGRVNTFAARNTGLATLEPNFLANHPSSSQFVFVGFQDNGSQVRVGDTVWEATFLGDGGGTVLHPVRSDLGVTQYLRGRWNGTSAEYVDPLTRQPSSAGNAGRESDAAAFYSGAAVVADTGTTARLALGTNRVWLTDNLGDGTPVRWRTLPYPNGTQTDARPGGTDPAPRRVFGVPGFVNPNLVDSKGASIADQMIDLAWQDGSTLLAMYRGGLVRYTNTSKAAGTWTTRTWDLTSIIVPIQANATLTAVAPLPAPSLDFYLSTLGDPANPATETLWYWDEAASTLRDTRFREVLDFPGPPSVTGPVDPVYALAVDPTDGADIYVGTATGVWKGRRQVAGNWVFVPFMNGLPDATVQDLDIWVDPAGAASSPRLLRAGVQSRGVWEVDLAQPETRRTYVRVHENDDRRMLPTSMANPRRAPSAPPRVAFASPDIAVRPAWPLSTPPPLHAPITSANVAVYDLWTFQTAFRWLYPSCVADGIWSDAMRDLVQFHRSVLGLPPGDVINQALWDAVVGRRVGGVVQGGVRLLPDPLVSSRASVTTNAADPLAVYRAPWQTRLTFDGAATEIDLMDTVRPVRTTNFEWTVFNEPSTVDILLHHRDSRPVPSGSAFAVLLWRFATTVDALLTTAAADLPPYLAAVVAAGTGAAPAAPAGWTVATTSGGSALRPLNTLLDARLPRAVSLDVDLSSPAVPANSHVLLLALVGSGADDLVPAPPAPGTVVDLVRSWPQAAMRVVRVRARV